MLVGRDRRARRIKVAAHLICKLLKQRERQPLETESDEVASLRCEPRTLARNDDVVDLSMTKIAASNKAIPTKSAAPPFCRGVSCRVTSHLTRIRPEKSATNCRRNVHNHCRHPAACARTGEVKPLRVTSPRSSNERPLPMHSSAIAVETRICSGCA